MKLPRVQLALLVQTVREALTLAEQGQQVDGYDCLVVGWLEAEEARDQGEPWAEQLVQCYRLVLADYARRFGLNRA